jgi:hypothetical protein
MVLSTVLIGQNPCQQSIADNELISLRLSLSPNNFNDIINKLTPPSIHGEALVQGRLSKVGVSTDVH